MHLPRQGKTPIPFTVPTWGLDPDQQCVPKHAVLRGRQNRLRVLEGQGSKDRLLNIFGTPILQPVPKLGCLYIRMSLHQSDLVIGGVWMLDPTLFLDFLIAFKAKQSRQLLGSSLHFKGHLFHEALECTCHPSRGRGGAGLRSHPQLRDPAEAFVSCPVSLAKQLPGWLCRSWLFGWHS